MKRNSTWNVLGVMFAVTAYKTIICLFAASATRWRFLCVNFLYPAAFNEIINLELRSALLC